MEWQRSEYEISDDKARLDVDFVHGLLSASYWAADRPRAATEKAIEHSVCFGVYHGREQVGFARAVTDYATFTYICDVVIAEPRQGRGLGKWLVECILAHPSLQTSTQCLRTRDAHSLYERHGFERTEYLRRSANDWSKRSAQA